jgi:hypothetical protein
MDFGQASILIRRAISTIQLGSGSDYHFDIRPFLNHDAIMGVAVGHARPPLATLQEIAAAPDCQSFLRFAGPPLVGRIRIWPIAMAGYIRSQRGIAKCYRGSGSDGRSGFWTTSNRSVASDCSIMLTKLVLAGGPTREPGLRSGAVNYHIHMMAHTSTLMRHATSRFSIITAV